METSHAAVDFPQLVFLIINNLFYIVQQLNTSTYIKVDMLCFKSDVFKLLTLVTHHIILSGSGA